MTTTRGVVPSTGPRAPTREGVYLWCMKAVSTTLSDFSCRAGQGQRGKGGGPGLLGFCVGGGGGGERFRIIGFV